MDYEKKYKEALEVAQRFYNNSAAITKKGLEDMFPELAESEDEKVRKHLISSYQNMYNENPDSTCDDMPVKDILDWLEKQKDTLKDTLKDIEQKPEWSEKDEEMIEKCLQTINHDRIIHVPKGGDSFHQDEINWLKSIRPQNTWKPSDEQMKILSIYANVNDVLASLYQDLKKLREE